MQTPIQTVFNPRYPDFVVHIYKIEKYYYKIVVNKTRFYERTLIKAVKFASTLVETNRKEMQGYC